LPSFKKLPQEALVEAPIEPFEDD
jgi:hypothetical protein